MLCPHCSGTFKGISGACCFQTGPDEEYSCDCLSVSSFGRSGEIPQHFNVLKEYQKLHFKNDPNLMIGSIGQGFILGLFNDSIHPKQPRCKVLTMTMRAKMAEGRPMTMLGSTTTQVRIAQCLLLGWVHGSWPPGLCVWPLNESNCCIIKKDVLGGLWRKRQGYGELLLAQNNTTANFLKSCYVLDGFIGVGTPVSASRRRK